MPPEQGNRVRRNSGLTAELIRLDSGINSDLGDAQKLMTRLGAMGSERCHFHGRPVLASEAIPLSTRGSADALPKPVVYQRSQGFAASADRRRRNRGWLRFTRNAMAGRAQWSRRLA